MNQAAALRTVLLAGIVAAVLGSGSASQVRLPGMNAEFPGNSEGERPFHLIVLAVRVLLLVQGGTSDARYFFSFTPNPLARIAVYCSGRMMYG